MSIDWLTIYGSIGVTPDSMEQLPNAGRFTLDYTHDRSNLYFKHSCIVRRDGFAVGVMCHQPTGHIMRPSTISFKVDNALLYSDKWYDVLLDFLIAFNVRFVTITRIDFALDFDHIGQHDWHGSELAQRFADGRLLRYGSRKYRIIGSGTSKINPQGGIEDAKGGIESVTFGSHNSTCQFQLYNKSLELKQKSIGDYCPKRYIIDCWEHAGLDMTRDIWRIELRLSGTAKTLVNHLTGEIEPLTLLALAPDHIIETIRAVFSKWCIIYDASFATASTDTHIDRLPRIQVLPMGDLIIARTIPQVRELPHARYIKGVMSTMERFTKELAQYLNDPVDTYIIGDAQRAIMSIYSYALAETRRLESAKVRERNARSLLDLLDLKPDLSPFEKHLYSYLKVTEAI